MQRPCRALSLALAASLAAGSVTLSLPIPRAEAADDTAKARTLFQEGVQLEAGGNFGAALSKFQDVAQIKRTPTVVFHIALCQEKLGQLVAALGGYRIAAHDAADDPKQAKVASTAQEAVTALEKRIPTLTFKRGKGAEVAKLSLDNIDVGGMVGKPTQVDPGAHQLEATAPGKEPFKEVVQVAEGENKTVEITLKDTPGAKPPPAASSGAAPPPTGTTGGTSTTSAPPPPTAPAPASIVPYAVLGAGGVSLLASGVFFLLRSGAASDLDSKCIQNVCPTSLQSTQDKGKTMTLLGNVTLGLGVVGVGVGAVLLLTQKPSVAEASAAASRQKFDLMINPLSGGMGANLVGKF
jgi:hypothetical protein